MIDSDNLRAYIRGARVQAKVVWALVLREVITRYGRENIGILWFFVEPILFIGGIAILWTFGGGHAYAGSAAELALVSYSTIMLWRNTTGRVIKAIEVNRPLLHHQMVKPIDFFYSRIILEFASVTLSFVVLYVCFLIVGIARFPDDLFMFVLGWLYICWFSFAFVLIMGALSEMNDVIEKISHVILYFMLPVSGAFIPAYLIPDALRNYLLYFPLVNCVEYFHEGYYGVNMMTYYDMGYTNSSLLVMTLLGFVLVNKSIRDMDSV